MKKINSNKWLQKTYTSVIIILLLGIVALQNNKFLGKTIFSQKSVTIEATSFSLEDIKVIFPSATSFELKNDSIQVFNSKSKIGWAYNSSPYTDNITGFASSTPILLGFDNENILVGIQLLKNYESPDFIDKMKKAGFMKQWNGLAIKEIPNKQIDAYSGSTLSSKAIIATMQTSTQRVLGTKSEIKEETNWLETTKTAAGYLLLALALAQFFFTKQLKKIRNYYQIAVILILGFWTGNFLSLFALHNWTIHGIDLSTKLFAFLVLLLSTVLPLVTNKSFYCAYLCPFGASQEIIGKINTKKWKLSVKTKEFLSTLREKIFATIMLLLFTGVSFDLTNVEPFTAFLYQTAALPILILAISFLILSIFIPRPWCKYACPTGYLFETIRNPFKKQ